MDMEDEERGEDIQVTHICDVCQKTFGWKGNLIRHKREVHERGVEEATCDVCNQKVLKRYFHEHLKVQHKIKRSKEYSLTRCFVCPCCPKKLPSMKKLRLHAQEDHGVNQEKECFTFRDEAEFNIWKKTTEKEGNLSFVVRQGPTKIKGRKKQVFHCHRSGKYVPKGRNLRAMKSQGTCKLGSYCTASVDAVYWDSQVQVTYHKTHFGHEMNVSDLLHVRIPDMDKQIIAGRLMEGATMEDVLEEIRDSSVVVDRKALLDKRDIRNIMHQYGVDKRQCELCDFTAEDLAALKKHMRRNHPHHQGFWCSHCKYKAVNKASLEKHRLKYHPRIYEKAKCLESVVVDGVRTLCDAAFALCARLRNHLAKQHGVFAALERETIRCETVDDFLSWKLGYVTGTSSEYTNQDKIPAAGKPVRYKCTRSSVYRFEERADRRQSAQGLHKFGQDCTSEMRAELRPDGTVIVTVFPFHYGHELGADSLLRPRVPAVDTDVAQGKMLQGLSKRRIIKDMRGSAEVAGFVGTRRPKFKTRFLPGAARPCDVDVSAHGAVNGTDSYDGNSQCLAMDAEDVVLSADVVPSTLNETTAELLRLRAEVADLRQRLQKRATADDLQRAELLRVFTPRQADILLGRRARSDAWDAEDLRRAIALRRVLTRRQYEHLRCELRLPLPALRSAAASAQAEPEKRRLYRRLLDQRRPEHCRPTSPTGPDGGGDAPASLRRPGELLVLRGGRVDQWDSGRPESAPPADHTDQLGLADQVEYVDDAAVMEGEVDPIELAELLLDQTVMDEVEVGWEDDPPASTHRARPMKVAITPGQREDRQLEATDALWAEFL